MSKNSEVYNGCYALFMFGNNYLLVRLPAISSLFGLSLAIEYEVNRE